MPVFPGSSVRKRGSEGATLNLLTLPNRDTLHVVSIGDKKVGKHGTCLDTRSHGNRHHTLVVRTETLVPISLSNFSNDNHPLDPTLQSQSLDNHPSRGGGLTLTQCPRLPKGGKVRSGSPQKSFRP